MAHQVEPMDIDDIEEHFDNKENTYHHSNVLARTPCTEKGYEELDVSELNMKLRWSTTPAASPMSKSMSHCLDNRYNASTDESLNNTVINENENNLTRSLNSTLNKTDSKLPLQALPADFVDSNRNSTVIRSLDDTVKGNDVTITVNNDNEIDNISFPSSSSSVTHTPEATTPTKEIPKNDGGSPIMRGLKSVLSMFRPSQSPIPPGEGEHKSVDGVLSPVDTSLLDPKPHAVSSTPINQKSKERSLSRINSPNKDSLVFNDDLEKELQWNDDSTIVFSTEKIPIHKLFFQDKASCSKIDKFCLPEKEDVNSSVEYMDVSYSNLSVSNRTLSATVNKSKVNDIESDGEFVDCETTFTQNESRSNLKEAIANKTDVEQSVPVKDDNAVDLQATTDIAENNALNNNLQSTFDVTRNVINNNANVHSQSTLNVTKHVENIAIHGLPSMLDDVTKDVNNDAIIDSQSKFNVRIGLENNVIVDPQSTFDNRKDVVQNTAPVYQQPALDATQDIIKLLDYSQIVGEAGEPLDFSTTDIVNQLSDLINASENLDTKMLSEHVTNNNLSNTNSSQIADVLHKSVIQPELLKCEVTCPATPVVPDNNTPLKLSKNVSFENSTHKLLASAGSNTLNSQVAIAADLSPVPAEAIALEPPNEKQCQDDSENEKGKKDFTADLAPVDIPLIIENVSKEINDHLFEDNTKVSGLQNKTMEIVEIPHNALFQIALEPPNEKQCQDDSENEKSKKDFTADLEPLDIPLIIDNVSKEINGHLFEDNTTVSGLQNKTMEIEEIPHNALFQITLEPPNEKQCQDDSENEKSKKDFTADLAPVDIPLFIENVSKEINDHLFEDNTTVRGLLNKTMEIVETPHNSLFQPLDETTAEKTEQFRNETENKKFEITSPPSILASDVPLPIIDNNNIVNTYLPHEALTAVPNPVLAETLKTSNTMSEEIPSNNCAKNIRKTEPSHPDEIEKIEISFKENLSETLGVDVSIKVKTLSDENEGNNEIPYPAKNLEESKKNIQLPNTLNDLPEVTMQNDNTNKSDEISIENLDIEKVLGLVSEAITDNDLAVHDVVNEFNSNVATEEKLTLLASGDSISLVETLLKTNKQDDITSSVNEALEPVSRPLETSLIVKEISQSMNGTEAATDLGVNTNAVNSVDALNVESLSSLAREPIMAIQPEIQAENKSEVRSYSIIQEAKVTECVNDFETTSNEEKSKQHDDKTEEEILLSENNSPFVSMSAEREYDPDTISKAIEITCNDDKPLQPAPISPKIVSKGYNFNFDDLDSMDPFATKTKIRTSPPLSELPNKPLEDTVSKKTGNSQPQKKDFNGNKTKSMAEKKRPSLKKKNFNSTFDSTQCAPTKQTQVKRDISNVEKFIETEIEVVAPLLQEVTQTLDSTQPDGANNVKTEIIPAEDKNTNMKVEVIASTPDIACVTTDDVLINDCKSSIKLSTSSSEQSTYFSAGASTDCSESRNVFNLPEIDDENFNPFANKSRIRQTPPPEDVVNPSVITDNNGNCSCSSKSSDERNDTVQEVHTEDEDTIEGPFLEAEDEAEGDKISESDKKINMVEFNNINDENTDAAEMFIDAEAFEFLMNQNKADEVAYSGKESLFLKFDPLFSRRVTSEGVAAALSEIKRRQITPKKAPTAIPSRDEEMLLEKTVAGPSNLNITHEMQSPFEESRDDMNVTVSKPMMVVPPAVNPVATPRQTATPNRTNRLSMTFTSPAMAVIDRLLSLSGSSPRLDSTVTHISQEHYEADQALTQLRELLAEKEINVYNLRCESKELKSRLSALETQMNSLEAESAQRLKKVNELTENLSEKTKMNRNMAAVVEEYERTIASLISETEQDKKRYAEERNQLIRERDEQSAHLTSMEVSFNDLHSKYEKSKQIIMGYKANEEIFKKSLNDFEENLAKMHSNYELLKQHATSKLNYANQELEKLNKGHEAEVLKFTAMIKRKDLHITSLEESLAQKTKANEELTAICDELINKVG